MARLKRRSFLGSWSSTLTWIWLKWPARLRRVSRMRKTGSKRKVRRLRIVVADEDPRRLMCHQYEEHAASQLLTKRSYSNHSAMRQDPPVLSMATTQMINLLQLLPLRFRILYRQPQAPHWTLSQNLDIPMYLLISYTRRLCCAREFQRMTSRH